MSLFRKPLPDETLVDGKGNRWRVVRDITPDIQAITDGRGWESSFIWRHPEGLNTWFSHIDENGNVAVHQG
jgi:hypothetical protein